MPELGFKARIGLMVPSVNTVAEPEMNRMKPEGVTIHSARILIPSDISTLEAFVRMCEAGCRNVAKAVRELATAQVDLYAFAFTAGSFFRGTRAAEEIAREVADWGKAPCVVTSLAIVEALKAFGIRRTAIVSPYAIGNELLKKFIEQNGIEVVSMKGLTLSSAQEEGRQTGSTFQNLLRQADAPGAESIMVACTNFATLANIADLEKSTGKLIISANQATFWASLRRLGIKDRLVGFGRLLAEH